MTTKARTVGQKRRLPRKLKAAIARLHPDLADAVDNSPTPQAKAQGAYTRSDTGTFTNGASTYLGKLELRKAITPRQRKGGEAFADCYRLAWSISGKDSCVLRVGGVGHETQSQAERTIARKAKLNRVLNVIGPQRYAWLFSVAVFEAVKLGRDRTDEDGEVYAMFRRILDACADEFDVPA